MPDYSNFLSAGGAVRNPEQFNRLKRDDNFVTFMARNIAVDIKKGIETGKKLKEQEDKENNINNIAQCVLSKVDYDSDFAEQVLDRITELDLVSEDDGTLEKVERTLHQRGLLKPSDFFQKKTPAMTGRVSPTPTYRPRGRSMPSDIFSKEQKKELVPVLGDMIRYLSGDKDVEIKGAAAHALLVLNGDREPHQVPITDTNSKEYLTAVKLWDHAMAVKNAINNTNDAFKVSSYNLRTEIALIGNLSSHEVYTKTLDPKLLDTKNREAWDYLERQSNWVPERAGIHAHIIETNMVQALALSRRLDTEVPSVWAVRGNTGAGKSYILGHDDRFKRALDDRGEPSGAINPDTIKGILMSQSRKEAKENHTATLSHGQLHTEGSALSFQYAEALGKEAVNATMIIDMRLAKASQVHGEVVGRAESRHGEALMLDVETPVITSINRVLTRDPSGNDPVVPLWAIKQGYMEVRSERAAVLTEVMTNDTIKYFKLIITNDEGEKEVAAVKENGVFKVMSGMEKKVERAMKKPEDDEVDKIVDQVIDDEYIKLAATRDHISSGKIDMIKRWKGCTVRVALERHGKGLGPPD